VFHWVRGIGSLLVRQWLVSRLPGLAGITATPDANNDAASPVRLVAELLLETVAFPVYFFDMTELEGTKVARFIWRPFHILLADGRVEQCNALDVLIDPVSRRWRQARLTRGDAKTGGVTVQTLSAADTLVLVWFDLVFTSHVKLHATANWAVNPQSPDAFVRRMGVTTVMYNYFGHTVFPKLGRLFYNVGILPTDGALVKSIIAAGVTEGVHSHVQASS